MNHSVQNIIKQNKCYACGMCQAVCPKGAATLATDRKSGFFRAQIHNDKCIQCGLCLQACPAAGKLNETGNALGTYDSLCLTHSADTHVRRMATSGGSVNALVRYLIESRRVQRAYLLMQDPNGDFECRVAEITLQNIKLLETNPRDFASRYVSYPICTALQQTDEPFAIVGPACIIKAVCKSPFAHNAFKIGIACSGAVSYHASLRLKQALGMPNARLYYRGDGWPGMNTLCSDGSTVQKPHTKSHFERMFQSMVFRRKACDNCNDQLAADADIVFFDFWNPAEMQRESVGNSGTIVRTKAARQILQDAAQAGYLHETAPLEPEEVRRSQALPLLLKEQQLHKKIPVKSLYPSGPVSALLRRMAASAPVFLRKAMQNPNKMYKNHKKDLSYT